ncbi:MAG: proline--tRNA ligase, partial [Sedimentisphaerales bacterium]|nr:proline--tRNA ligase [Sedimentisphaerales bacterium]
YSQMLIPTVKEIPADAEIPSHKLMIRAALMRKLASGTYTYLPLGWRSLGKVIAIVRQEMNKAGAQEILMPAVQPIELWERTGRDVEYGPTMAKFKDRHGHLNVLAPTAEEVVTSIAAGAISSYKQLPINLYQISFKFRDEFRPRFGVLRSREFIMKDAYSFNADQKSLDETYNRMYETYCRIFKRCGLGYVVVEAESGEMGGSGSHQFTVPCDNGEDVIVHTEDNSYAANLEKAAIDRPAGQQKKQNIPATEDVNTPNVGTIEAVCDFLKTKPKDMIKTLIYSAGEKVVVALVRGDHDVNPEKLTQLLQGEAVELADEPTIEKASGAKVGFAGPMGLADKVSKIVIDHAVAAMAVGVTGANKTDYHTKNVVPGRDFPLQGEKVIVADIRYAVEGDTHNGRKLLFKRGIEIGQLFRLGTKYSEKLGAKFLDESGSEQPCIMGCYGIGINRIVASAIETGNDKDGIIWPISIAPFEVIVTSVNQDDEQVAKVAEDIYRKLLEKGVDVLLDDRGLRGGVKFKDADLIGIPVRVTVGKKSVSEGKVEVKLRSQQSGVKVPIEKGSDKAAELVDELKKGLTA